MSFQQITPIRVVRRCEIGDLHISEFIQPPDMSIGLHSHEKAILTIPLAGSFLEMVERRRFTCIPGTLLIKPAGTMHTHEYGRSGAHCLLIETTLHSTAVDLRQLPMRIAEQIWRELQINDEVAQISIEEFTINIVQNLPERKVSRVPPKWLSLAKQCIDDCFDRRLRLQDIANVSGVHPTHLAEMFPRYFKSTVGNYVRRLRLDHAMKRLTEGNASIAEIAVDAGFYDQSHFHRFFQRYTGMTPARARHHGTKLRMPKIVQD